MSDISNTIVVLDLLIRGTEYTMKLQQALQRAQAEGRDITDEEVQAIRDGNLAKIDELLSRSH